MSYDIKLVTRMGEVIHLKEKHDLIGGTYQCGGTTEATLNITYNYSKFYDKHIDPEEGIRKIYGMKVLDGVSVLISAVQNMEINVSENYWEATEGNARRSLVKLIILGLKVIVEGHNDAEWVGD